MRFFKLTYILPIMLLAVLTACSSDDVSELNNGNSGSVEAADANVTFNLGVTRGVLQPTSVEDELIQSYLIVVTDAEKNIIKILSAPSLPAAEMHSVKASLPAGNYKVFAFGNIPFSADGDWLYGKFAVGRQMPDMSQMYYGGSSFKNGYNGLIPLCAPENGLDLEILSAKGNTTYGIEVVRMVAKLEFVFTNSSSKPVEVSEIMIGPLTKPSAEGMEGGYIPLGLYDDSEKLRLYSDDTHHCEDDYYVHSANVSLSAGNSGDGKTNVVRFNIIESEPDPVTKQFHMRFKVKYDGVEEYRYAMLDKSLTGDGQNTEGEPDKSPFIRRNDWIRIPIDMGDYELKLEARSFPPIGGYPEADIEEQDGGFRVNFKTPGDFIIRPFIRKFGTHDWVYLTDTSKIASYTLEVDTSTAGFANIFSKAPVKKGNEIHGAISSGTSGTALVTLTINISDGSVTRKLVRKMYITYKL